MIDRRAKRHEEKKSFLQSIKLPDIILSILLWLFLISLILFADPEITGVIIIFFILVFSAIFFTVSIFSNNLRRKIIVALAVTLFLILKYFKIGNLINLFLIVGIALLYELYSQKSN